MNSPSSCEILYINLAWGDYTTVDSMRLCWIYLGQLNLKVVYAFWPKPEECFSRQQLPEKFAETSAESKLPCEALARKSTPQSSIQFVRFNKGVRVGLNKFLEPKKIMVALGSNGCRPIFILALVGSNCLVDFSQAFCRKKCFFFLRRCELICRLTA